MAGVRRELDVWCTEGDGARVVGLLTPLWLFATGVLPVSGLFPRRANLPNYFYLQLVTAGYILPETNKSHDFV